MAAAAADAPPLPAGDAETSHIPLSMQQQRWLRLIRGGYGQRVIPIVFHAKLAREEFVAALKQVVDRHELLRCTYPGDECRVLATKDVLPSDEALFFDLRHLNDAARREAFARHVEECRGHMPDPAQAAPWTVRCLDMADEKFVVLLSAQHLEFDGSSLGLFVDELRNAYRARRCNRSPSLPDFIPYKEYARRQVLYRATAISADRCFFEGMYATMREITTLPGHGGFDRTKAYPSERYTPQPARGLWEQICAAAERSGTSTFSVLLACYARHIAGLTRRGEVSIGMIQSGRGAPEFASTIGPFTSPFPLRIATEGRSGRELIRQCNFLISAVASRPWYPVVDLIDVVPAFKGMPIDTYFADISINFTNYRRQEKAEELRVDVLEILGPIRDAEFAGANNETLRRVPGLHLVADFEDEEIRFNFWYHAHRFSQDLVAQWANAFLAAARELLADVSER